MPLYLPVLMLVTLLLILYSKEIVNYSKHRIIVFLIGFFIIIFSETTIRFINTSLINNLIIIGIPLFNNIFIHLF